jgi:hypothetical protein
MQENKREDLESTLNPDQNVILYKEYTVGEKTIKLYNTDSRERLDVETYEEYKIRQKLNNILNRAKLQGGLWWDSARWGTQTKQKLDSMMTTLLQPETLNQ